MLPAASRVRTRSDHRVVAQAGRRVRRGSLVVAVATPTCAGQPRAAVVAGRRVGSAVVRNKVRRRLQELIRPRLGALSPGTLIVVRALPGAADASFDQLGSWLDAGLRAGARQPATEGSHE